MKVYISGKITGLDYIEAQENFKTAENYIVDALGVTEIINPMSAVPYVKGKGWKEYMVEDIKLLLECHVIFMLNNWRSSKGARIELGIAVEMGMDVIFQTPD